MKSSSGVSAIVLAAGMSSRMGSVKQLLPFHGKPLLQIVLDTLKATRVDEIVLVLGHEQEQIRNRIELGEARIVVNDQYREGMGTSLSAGISSLSAETAAALIVLADQPFLKSETIDQLIAAYTESKPAIAIPTHQGFRGNPVLVDRSLFPEVKTLAGDMGLRAIFSGHARDILKVAVNDAGILLDVDTATDLEQAGRIEDAVAAETELLALTDLPGRMLPEIERHLVIVGAHAVAKALAGLGALLKFYVTVVDLLVNPDDMPGADRVLQHLDFSLLPQSAEKYVVVASQGRFDEDAVEQALLMEAGYVGLVSNRKKAQDLINSLASKGVPEERLLQLKVPAGLDIKAETPEEIALSIMAQIILERNSSKDAKTK